MRPKALVLQAHGTNRDLDVIEALLAGAEAMGVPLNELRRNKTLLSEYQLLVLPGGFSYTDALGAGKLLALDLTSYFEGRGQSFDVVIRRLFVRSCQRQERRHCIGQADATAR